MIKVLNMFQSTLARGERPRYHHSKSLYDSAFQSTLARGERLYIHHFARPFAFVSIHARAGRATPAKDVRALAAPEFQSTLARGERLRT